MKPSELLDAAADKIETVGWCQEEYRKLDYGNYERPVVGYCTMGSMREVLGIGPWWTCDDAVDREHPEYGQARKVLKKVMLDQLDTKVSKYSGHAIPRINDEDGRTAEEIVMCMRKAARGLEA